MTDQGRNVVLGLGNTLCTDEGTGVHALLVLQRLIGSETDAELLDGGTLGLSLLPIVEESSHLLVLDAVDAGQPGGSILELNGEAIPLFTGIKLSEHQLTFQEVLGLAKIRGKFPRHLHLIGVQPQDLSVGMGMSPVVSRSLPEILVRSQAVLQRWGLLPAGKELHPCVSESREESSTSSGTIWA